MADTKTVSVKLMSPEARLSYPFLFRPAPPMAGNTGEPKYSASLIFPKTADLVALKAAAMQCARDKWGPKADDMMKNRQARWPFRDGAEREGEGYGDGTIFINATSKQKPGVVDQKVQPIIDEGEMYPGCYVRATLRPFAYDKAGNKGVSFGLGNVQKLRDGDPLGNRTRPQDDFEAVGDEGGGTGSASDFSDLV